MVNRVTRPLTLVLLLVLLAACGVVRPRSMEAAPQEDTFEDDVTSARVLSEEFWKQQFVALGRTYRPVQDFVAYDGENGPMCGDQPSVPNNAFYCPLGHFIAYDARWMRGLWQDMGDGSVYLIIPHEFGHAVQAQLETQFQLNVQQELQADCYAGGTLAALVKSGTLRAEPGDEEELLLNLAAAGDPTEDWFNPQAHGTAEQRQASFAAGYRDGVGGCG